MLFAMGRDTSMGCSIELLQLGCLHFAMGRNTPMGGHFAMDRDMGRDTPMGCSIELLQLWMFALRDGSQHADGRTLRDGSRRIPMQTEYDLNERHRERRVSFVRL
jgi:hypothetical protein